MSDAINIVSQLVEELADGQDDKMEVDSGPAIVLR
jgi:hypothetical protein